MSVLSRGILALRTTLVGVVQVDPKKLLEEVSTKNICVTENICSTENICLCQGIRRELVNRVASILHNTLSFNTKSKDRVGDLSSKIKLIAKEMEGFRKSFEYIEDYINIPGLRLWQEEISRIINHAVEREAAGFLKNAGDSYNQFQSLAVPIPEFFPVPGDTPRCAPQIFFSDTKIFLQYSHRAVGARGPARDGCGEQRVRGQPGRLVRPAAAARGDPGPELRTAAAARAGSAGYVAHQNYGNIDTAKPAEADGLSLNPRDFCTKTSHRTSVTYFAVCTLTPSE